MSIRDGAQPTVAQIVLRPVGSPITIGMSGLAVASLVETGVDLHWVAAAQVHDAGLILIAVPFVLQLIGCVFSYLARDGATGAAVGLLSTSWLATGLIQLVAAPGVLNGPLGLMFVSAGVVLVLSAVAVGVSKPLPGGVFALAGIRFILSGAFELGGGPLLRELSGVSGLVILAVACYTGLAFELEDQLHRPVLPTFRRGPGRRASVTEPSGQLDALRREAGIRSTS